MVSKMSLLMIRKTLQLCVNTLTADDKYSLLSTDNLTRPIQMELFPKTKSFLSPCFSIFEIALNFEKIQKKDDPHI